jgi:hypothetical protein
MKYIDVGFIGLAGSGKDTAAQVLTGGGWRRAAFADKLKSLAFAFGWDGYKDERGRRLLQDLGMAARAYNPNFWIDEADRGIQIFPKLPRVWTDVRFQNEADFVRGRGGIIIRIKRPEQISSDQHESELNQFDIRADYEVVNGGTIEDLHAKILEILK